MPSYRAFPVIIPAIFPLHPGSSVIVLKSSSLLIPPDIITGRFDSSAILQLLSVSGPVSVPSREIFVYIILQNPPFDAFTASSVSLMPEPSSQPDILTSPSRASIPAIKTFPYFLIHPRHLSLSRAKTVPRISRSIPASRSCLISSSPLMPPPSSRTAFTFSLIPAIIFLLFFPSPRAASRSTICILFAPAFSNSFATDTASVPYTVTLL